MKIPKKIHLDCIRDSIVEVKYTSSIPFEIIIGTVYNRLDDTYKYTNQVPQGNDNQSTPTIGNFHQEIMFSILEHSFFYNDRITLQLARNSMIFNCLSDYIGWENYREEIKRVLQQIESANIINSFSRIGVRFISEYSGMDIVECTNFNYSLGGNQASNGSFQFRKELTDGQYRIILSLENILQSYNGSSDSTSLQALKKSMIDIDFSRFGYEKIAETWANLGD